MSRRLIHPAVSRIVLFAGLVTLSVLVPLYAARAADTDPAAGTPISLTGRLIDSQGSPVKHAEISLILNGQPMATDEQVHSATNAHELGLAESQPDGTYVLEVPPEFIGHIDTLTIHVSRHHLQSLDWRAGDDLIADVNEMESVRLPDLEMARRVTAGFWIASLTFVAMLALIAFELLHNTMAALLGVAVILGISLVGGAVNPDLYIFDFEKALEYVDFEVVFLVMGMMIVIAVIEETGIFQWLAYQSYQLSGGRTWLLVIILMLITSVASALLDNVTTMLLMTPMTIQISLAMGVNPLTLLLPEVLASNIGGISTLIGTPTNILIGSYAGLSFNDFMSNLTPGVLMAQIALTAYVLLRFRKQFRSQGEILSQESLDRMQEGGRITQPIKLRKASLIFVLMLLLFIFGERFHLVPAVTAILGAAAMLLWVSTEIEDMIRAVDWTTLMFFISLFIVVGAVQEVGLISIIADTISRLVSGDLTVAILLLIWSAAFLSGVIANIPFTAAMLPVVAYLTRTIPGASNQVLFYALSVGSAMGGNSSIIGASANLVTAGIAQRAGYEISYRDFLKIGMPAMIITVAVGTLWMFIRF